MFWVYVLRSAKSGRRYTGSCHDLDNRLREHNAGESPSTRHGVPWSVIDTERHPTKAGAGARERYFKTGKGRDDLKRLLAQPAAG